MPFRKTFTKHLLDGRQVPAGTAGAIEVKQTSKVWYAKIDGKLVSLGTDFRKAESYEKAHRGQAEREAHGLADPFAVHRTRPLAEHLEDFRKAMTGANATAAHVDQKIGRIKAMFDGCGFKTVDDVDATRVSEWLSLKRAGGTEFELPAKMTEFEPRQAVALLNVSGTALRAKIKRLGLPATGHGKARKYPRATLQAVLEADAKGIGPATCNHYLVAARSFLNWMRRNRRIAFNPLDTLKLLNERGDVRRNRRELDAAELKALLAATRASTRSYRGMDGEARFHLYLTAFVTGYRASGLSKLTPDDFHLDGDLPVITLATRHNKFQRRMMTQPVPPFAVDTLKAYVADKPAAVPLWGGTWAKDHKGAEMLRGDLAAAGIPYTVDGPGGIEYRDFHALRHGLLTHGGRAGIDVLTLKEIAGHADAKTTQRYVHLRVHDVAGAMDRIPSILPDETNVIVEKELLKATGTDLVSPEYPPAMAISGHSLASSDNHAMVKGAGHETTKPLLSQGFRHVLAIAGSDGQGEDDGTRTRNLRRDRPPIASPQATKGKRLAPDLKSWHPPSIPLDTAETTISVPVDASGTVDTKALADALKALPLTFAERARLAGLLLADA